MKHRKQLLKMMMAAHLQPEPHLNPLLLQEKDGAHRLFGLHRDDLIDQLLDEGERQFPWALQCDPVGNRGDGRERSYFSSVKRDTATGRACRLDADNGHVGLERACYDGYA